MMATSLESLSLTGITIWNQSTDQIKQVGQRDWVIRINEFFDKVKQRCPVGQGDHFWVQKLWMVQMQTKNLFDGQL